MRRIVNRDLLRSRIEMLGECGVSKLREKSLVSCTTIEKLRAGSYKSEVSAKIRKGLCQALEVSEDDLFPLVSAS